MMQTIATRNYSLGSTSICEGCSSSKKDTCLVSEIKRSCSDSRAFSVCSTSVSSNASGTGSAFFSSQKRVDTAPIKPQHHEAQTIKDNTLTNKGSNGSNNNKNLLSMIDQMLEQHDRVNKGRKDRYGDDSDNDDNYSCSSIASYHSLNFGDDGKGYYDSDDDTLSTASGSSFASDDGDDDYSADETSYFDEDYFSANASVVDDSKNCKRNKKNRHVTDNENAGYNNGDGDDNDECSISTYGSRYTKEADSLVVDLKNVSSSSSITSLKRRWGQSKSAYRRHVHFNENVRVKPIRHVNDMSDAEVQRLYMNSEEAYEIRMDCLDMVQLMEEQEEKEGAQVLDKFYCTRGLEKHAARNNEALLQQRELLCVSVFKIQSLCLPPGLMDMEATIAQICTKLTAASVVKALKFGAYDAKEVGFIR